MGGRDGKGRRRGREVGNGGVVGIDGKGRRRGRGDVEETRHNINHYLKNCEIDLLI